MYKCSSVFLETYLQSKFAAVRLPGWKRHVYNRSLLLFILLLRSADQQPGSVWRAGNRTSCTLFSSPSSYTALQFTASYTGRCSLAPEMMQGLSAWGKSKYLDILCERQASVGYLWGRALPHEPIIHEHWGATMRSFLWYHHCVVLLAIS